MNFLRELWDLAERDTQPARQVNVDYENFADRVAMRGKRTNAKSAQLGNRGLFGTAYDQQGDVNKVVKLARVLDDKYEADGYTGFLEHILNMENPFFPQIDEMKKYVDKSGKPFFTVRMEKLTPMSALSGKELAALFRSLFGREVTEEDWFDQPMPRRNTTPAQKLAAAIASNLEKCMTGELRSDLKIGSEHLRDALRLLWQMHMKGYAPDLHSENVMVRRTPYGPQLVFTDPFTEKINRS